MLHHYVAQFDIGYLYQGCVGSADPPYLGLQCDAPTAHAFRPSFNLIVPLISGQLRATP